MQDHALGRLMFQVVESKIGEIYHRREEQGNNESMSEGKYSQTRFLNKLALKFRGGNE